MGVLDKAGVIEKIDRHNMLNLLVDFPKQAEKAVEIGRKALLPDVNIDEVQNIVICGMGGSAIGGDLLRSSLIDKMKIPLFVNRNYTLPAFVSHKSLVFVCSYSGNTEEAISSAARAKERGAAIVILSSNGALEDIAGRQNAPFIKIPAGLPPRCALGYSFFPLLMLVSRLKLVNVEPVDLEETFLILEEIKKENNAEVNTCNNLAKKTALKLFKKLVVIYAWADYYEAAAYRFRCQLAENSKNLSSHHLIPEMNHNEIMGWRYPKSLLKKIEVVVLADKMQHQRVTKRIEILLPIIEKRAHGITQIFTRGNNLLAKIFSLIYTADFISFYLAVLNRVDPVPVDTISYLKERLSE